MRGLMILLGAPSTAVAEWLSGGVNGNYGAQSQLPLGQSGALNPFTKDFERLANKTLDKYKVPGVAIAIIDGDDIHAKGFGSANLPDTPATADTLWCAGSTTKAFTAATISHLIHQDQHPSLQPLGWSTTISSLIRDDFVLEDDWATQHLTLDDAVSHRTGMSRHDLSYSTYDEQGKPMSLRDNIRKFGHLPIYEQPRVVFQYCNLMWMAVSHVVETLTGRWLGDVMRDVIWTPLGMNSTFLGYEDIQPSARNRMADAYYFDYVDGDHKVISPMSLADVSGAGAIISSANDYARWVRALLQKGEPFSEEVHNDIRRPRMINDLNGNSLYGLGWMKSSYHGHRQYFHNGGTDGFGTNVYWYPDDGYGVVAFGNTASGSSPAETELILALVNEKFGIEAKYDPEYPLSSIEQMDSHVSQNSVDKDPNRCDFEEGADIVFPDRPQTPIRLPGNISDLAGAYRHPGYGTLNFTVKSIPERTATGSEPQSQLRLVASRPSSTWRYSLELRHISGSYFLICFSTASPELAVGFGLYRQAEFKLDVNGKAEGVWIDMDDLGKTYPRANIWFERVR